MSKNAVVARIAFGTSVGRLHASETRSSRSASRSNSAFSPWLGIRAAKNRRNLPSTKRGSGEMRRPVKSSSNVACCTRARRRCRPPSATSARRLLRMATLFGVGALASATDDGEVRSVFREEVILTR